MSLQFEKAGPGDYEELMDLGNYVFSHAHAPTDFPTLLPKLYRREYFMDGIHYIVREGDIKAAVGAYPLTLGVCGDTLPGRGIGMVSVHPYHRSRGFMKALMNMALEDMRREGLVFSCLGGQRQRYAYFGYQPVGMTYSFDCGPANIRHTLGERESGLSLHRVGGEDREALDYIYRRHEAKPAAFQRRRDRLFDILSSWGSLTFVIREEGRIRGCLLYQPRERLVHEINLEDDSLAAGVIGLLLRTQEGASGGVRVRANPQDRGKIAALGSFAETWSLGPAYSFTVFDYRRFIPPFLRLAAARRRPLDGEFTVQIEGGPRLCLAVSGGEVAAKETRAPADLTLSPRDALGFFFAADGAAGSDCIAANPYLQSLLPLPLFFEAADGV